MTSNAYVYWGQSLSSVFIKVDLKDVKEPHIVLEKRKLFFRSEGFGKQGFKEYEFTIIFFSGVDENKNDLKVTDRNVLLTLTKLEKGWWPRLTSHTQKLLWLKLDFDYLDLYARLLREEDDSKLARFKKTYLTTYNLFMFFANMYILRILYMGYNKDGPNFFPVTYENVGQVFCCIQLFQFLEVMHYLFFYVKGGVFMPLMRMIVKFFIVFLMINQEPRIQKMPVVYYIFFIYSAAEVSRYPYYMAKLYQKKIVLLTWLRYTVCLFLYPAAFFFEGVLLLRNLIFIEQSGKWSITIMPNELNFSFNFATFLKIFVFFIMMPVIYISITDLYRARKRKLKIRTFRIKKEN